MESRGDSITTPQCTITTAVVGGVPAVEGNSMMLSNTFYNFFLYCHCRSYRRLTSRPTYSVRYRSVFACCTGYRQVSGLQVCQGI